jgi:hypothetical protein
MASCSGRHSVCEVKDAGYGRSPELMSKDPVTVDELAEKADEYLHEASLTLEEYEALKQSVAELTPIFSAENSYFVLGSYGKHEIRRLQLVKDRLNRQPGAYAFLMVDIRSE